MTEMTCETARQAITTRRFIGWSGLPRNCSPEAAFGIALDDSWGSLPLGSALEPARSRLLELGGYYRPLAYVRDGVAVAFDAMNPQMDGDWRALAESLGAPDAALDWVFGTVPMTRGERVYAARGITLWLNPETQAVVYVTVYAPATVDVYKQRIQPPREKRSHRK